MHNYRSNQSAFMTRFRTDLRHQYGIFDGKSQPSLRHSGREQLAISNAAVSKHVFQIHNFLYCLCVSCSTKHGFQHNHLTHRSRASFFRLDDFLSPRDNSAVYAFGRVS